MPTFTVALDGPLDLPASFAPFGRHGDDLLDRWDGTVLLRTVPTASGTVPVAIEPAGTPAAPALTITAPSQAVAPALTAMFVRADRMLATLARDDAVIGALARAHPGVVCVLALDPFTAIVRAITAQQINLRFACVVRRRITEAFGTPHNVGAHIVYSLEPARLAPVDPAELRALQLTTRKAEYVVGLARAVTDGTLDLAALAALPDDDVIDRLVAIRGLGRWTAEWLLARTFGRPRVVAGDLGVRKAVGLAYGHGELPTEGEVRALTAHWGDAAAAVQHLLLHALAEGTLAGIAR